MQKDRRDGQDVPAPEWATLEGWARLQVQEFLQRLLEEEVTALLGRQRSERRREVDAPSGYRNGYQKPRRLSMQGGTITVRRPRVRNLEEKFESRILPLFRRRTEEVGRLLPELYLHGLALGDFELALRGLLGEGAPLSASSIARLKADWHTQYEAWSHRLLGDRKPVYLWADGIYVKAGLDKEKAALLVVICAHADGRKEVLALTPGFRESRESWAGVFRDLRDRGLIPPRLVLADGNTGVWAAVAEIWPEAAEQRCWNHKIVNVLDRLPKKVQPEARQLLTAIPYARSRAEAQKRRDAFVHRFGQWYPQATETLLRDFERMLTFYDFPQEHWRHLRTTNPVESPFSAVRLRTGAARRFKKTENATCLIWKVLMVAEKNFRRVNAPELMARVWAGEEFKDGLPVVTQGTEEKVAA